MMQSKSLRLTPLSVPLIPPDCELWLFAPFPAHPCLTPWPEHRVRCGSGESTHGTPAINSQSSSGRGDNPSLGSERVPLVLGESSPLEETASWTHLSPFINPPTSLPTPHFRVTDRYLKAQKRRVAIKQYGTQPWSHQLSDRTLS